MKFRPAKKAFQIEDLPKTRGQEFWDFFKTRFILFLEIGGILLLFGIPFLFSFLLKYYALLYPASKSMAEAEYLFFYKTTTLLFSGIYSLCFFFLFLALGGIGRIVRQWIWGNGIYFWHDFGKGVKQNFKNYLLFWLCFSFFFVLDELLSLMVGNSLVANLISGVFLLFLPVLMMAMVETLVYSDPFFRLLRNAFSYLLKRPLIALLFFLFPCAVVCLTLVDQIMIQFLLFAILFALILPFYLVGWSLYCFSLFDEFTNKESYPSLYKKGLRHEFEKEDER